MLKHSKGSVGARALGVAQEHHVVQHLARSASISKRRMKRGIALRAR
jgi:hypothetical protein